MAEHDNRNPGTASDANEDLLSPYWAVMRRMSGADKPKQPETATERMAAAHPGELVIMTGRGGALVRIRDDGSVVFEEGATPDDAARALWEAVGRQRSHFEERRRYLDLLELHVALLFVSDQAYEAAQLAAHSPEATEHIRFREELSRRSLETRVHGMIEFAREFAMLRPDLIELARRTAVPDNAPEGVR
ncbi:MAG: hypothetical protein ACREP9_04300 [Candidatus Dormibacteraceae bacterium]